MFYKVKIQVIIPVCNPDNKFNCLLNMIKVQSIGTVSVLIIDSGEQHEYQKEIINEDNYVIKYIKNIEFNHGGTRQMGIEENPDKEVYVFLTQDAVLADVYSIENLVACFKNKKIGCAYGRQLPHKNANFLSAFARMNNYGEIGYVYSYEDKKEQGIKTCFISNSFAAYRREAIRQVEGFPTNTILSEDVCVAAKMLINGWDIAYIANACVYHSHNYTIFQEFKRYFDIGVFHFRESWIRQNFGQAERAGGEFIKKEIREILKNNPLYLFEMILRDGMKFIGYRLGINEEKIPLWIKQKISMNKRFWMSSYNK